MSSMMVCRLGGDNRTVLVRCPFRPDAIRSSRATPSAPRCGSEGVDVGVLWRLPNRRAILRRPPFVSRRFQCRMTASGAKALSDTPAGTGRCPPHCWPASGPLIDSPPAKTIAIKERRASDQTTTLRLRCGPNTGRGLRAVSNPLCHLIPASRARPNARLMDVTGKRAGPGSLAKPLTCGLTEYRYQRYG